PTRPSPRRLDIVWGLVLLLAISSRGPRAYARTRVRGLGVSSEAMPQHPRCAATLKDGSPCERVTVTPSAPFCSHHTELLGAVDAETMRQGRTPKEPGGKKERPLRVIAERKPKASKPSMNGATLAVADPASVRPRLAEAAAENVEQLKASL